MAASEKQKESNFAYIVLIAHRMDSLPGSRGGAVEGFRTATRAPCTTTLPGRPMSVGVLEAGAKGRDWK
jgi:hypothetical protein